MEIAVQPASAEHAEGLQTVYATTFRAGEPVERDLLADPEKAAFVATAGGSVVGCYFVLRMNIGRGAATVRGGGIAAVAVLPEYRHRGVGRAMMRWSIEQMRRDGMAIALLYPFSERYYRTFGYEVCGVRNLVTCPLHRLPTETLAMPVRRIEPSDVQLLDDVYRAHARRLSGSNLRSARQWKDRLGQRAPMIYAVGEPIEAYAWFTPDTSFWEDLRFGEFCWANPSAYRQMLSAMAGIGINRTPLSWQESSEGPFMHAFSDQGVRFNSDRECMYRLLDVPAAFRALEPQASGEFRLAVTDEIVPGNRGPWKISFEPGSCRVEPTLQPEVHADIGRLTQAFLGEPSMQTLLNAGWIECDSEVAAHAACSLLPARPTCCYDFF